MKLINNTFLIVSKCGKLIAKGTPRNRYICHIDENDKKRFLTYSSKNKANSAFQNSGFYLSDFAKEYMKKEYPNKVSSDNLFIFWEHIKYIFEIKEFQVIYESINAEKEKTFNAEKKENLMNNITQITRCNNCIHYEETPNKNNVAIGYCHYWNYEQGMSPNMVYSNDFCSNAESIKKTEITIDNIKGFMYSEHGAVPICILECIEENNPKLLDDLTFEIKKDLSKRNLQILVNQLYKLVV